MSEPIIRLSAVSKTVPSTEGPLTILHPLDLDVAAGDILAVVGPSGSGKSTLLGLIAGLDEPTTGTIEVDGSLVTALGEDALARLRSASLGFIFQSFHLIPSLTALENVSLPIEITGRRGATARAAELLDQVGLGSRRTHYPSQLSGGEQQRVAIARAFANDPPILLADEPTGNLDTATGHQVIDLLLRLNESRGTTLVLVTHDRELAALAPRRIALEGGQVVEDTASRAQSPSLDGAVEIAGDVA
ncbi:MAG: ABC transporter ATP-binding protein [Acidobacteria bacterium]|nr:ABC transporter ATP-binding protein [Acidobacteriota bacterium]